MGASAIDLQQLVCRRDLGGNRDAHAKSFLLERFRAPILRVSS